MKQSTIHLWHHRGWFALGLLAIVLCSTFAADAWLTEDWNGAFMAACLFALFMFCRNESCIATHNYLHWWCVENGVTNEDGYPLTEIK